MSPRIIFSHVQATPLLQARREGRAWAETSTDLGLTAVEVCLCPEGVQFPAGQELSWGTLAEIAASENACFHIHGGGARKIDTFSEFTGRYYSLMPTTAAPTLLVSGIPMHRIKNTDPYRDTLVKVRAVAPIAGRVLDTSTGLGYTAIEAAKTADEVITIELDPSVLEIARLNPWSQSLFDNPVIQQIVGDSFQKIAELEGESFSRIIHDPPTLSLAGELYSLAFYRRAYHVLKHGGRMFHYVGNPESKSGARVTSGVVRRLQEAGFRKVQRRPKAFGLVAYK